MMFLWAIIIIGFLFYFYKEDVPFKTKNNPKEILKKRLAKGEITLTEYNRILAILEEDYESY